MHSFRNDYSELAHPEILKLINQFSDEQNIGYGLNKHSERARHLIHREINNHEAGAIEASGHKILTVPGEGGKITVEEIE